MGLASYSDGRTYTIPFTVNVFWLIITTVYLVKSKNFNVLSLTLFFTFFTSTLLFGKMSMPYLRTDTIPNFLTFLCFGKYEFNKRKRNQNELREEMIQKDISCSHEWAYGVYGHPNNKLRTCGSCDLKQVSWKYGKAMWENIGIGQRIYMGKNRDASILKGMEKTENEEN